MKKHKEERLGELWIGLSVILEAGLPVGIHFGATQIPPIQFLAYVTLISALLFVPILILKKQWRWLKSLRTWALLLAYTLLLTTPFAIIFYATRFSSAIETTLLMQSELIFALLFGYFFLQERISKSKLFGVFCIFLANTVLFYQANLTLNWANVALFLAPSLFVCGNAIAKKLQKEGVSWALILGFRAWVGGLLLLALASGLEGLQTPSKDLLPFLLIFGVFVWGLGKIFWQLALHRLDISKVTALGLSYPGISLILAFLWLHEIPTPNQWLSIAIMAIGVGFLLRTNSRQWTELA